MIIFELMQMMMMTVQLPAQICKQLLLYFPTIFLIKNMFQS